MVYRQTRLTARLLYWTVFALAAFALAVLGPETMLPLRPGKSEAVPVWQAMLRAILVASVMMAAHGWAARVKRWRRNIIRAGGVFATSWLGSLTLVVAIQLMQIAAALGHPVDQARFGAGVIGVLVLFRANLLPKSRPAWFNGVALPVFASRTDIWCRVHRASALRLFIIGLVGLGLAAFGPAETDLVQPIIILLLGEVALSTAHALWLGAVSTRREGQVT